jgi:hypothetical protein
MSYKPLAIKVLLGTTLAATLGGGLYYYASNSTANSAKTVETIKPSASPQAQSLNVKKKSENNKAFLIGFDYPDTAEWTLKTVPVGDGDATYAAGDRAYMSVKYIGCGENCGLAFSVMVVGKGLNSEKGARRIEDFYGGNSSYALDSKTEITINGVKGTRYALIAKEATQAPIIWYYFQSKDFSYYIVVNYNGAKTDKIDLISEGEKIVQSLRFL